MNIKSIAYWATTGLVSLAMLGSGAGYLSGAINGVMEALGYPTYIVYILGVWKLLVAPALLSPGFRRLKEWAYAGLFFNLTGAAASHAFAGHTVGEIAPPLVMLGLAAVSWWLYEEVRFGEAASAVSAPSEAVPAT